MKNTLSAARRLSRFDAESLQPFGALRSTFHRPLADVQFEIAPKWTAIVRWNYYEYAENNAFIGPMYPRGFHANATTLSLRYAF